MKKYSKKQLNTDLLLKRQKINVTFCIYLLVLFSAKSKVPIWFGTDFKQ